MDQKRIYARYPCHLEIKIIGDGSRVFTGETCDISNMGMNLVIPRVVVSELSYTGLNMEVGDKLQISVSDGNTEKKHLIHCTVAHARRLSQNLYSVGVYFLDPKPETRFFINNLFKNAQSAQEKATA